MNISNKICSSTYIKSKIKKAETTANNDVAFRYENKQLYLSHRYENGESKVNSMKWFIVCDKLAIVIIKILIITMLVLHKHYIISLVFFWLMSPDILLLYYKRKKIKQINDPLFNMLDYLAFTSPYSETLWWNKYEPKISFLHMLFKTTSILRYLAIIIVTVAAMSLAFLLIRAI